MAVEGVPITQFPVVTREIADPLSIQTHTDVKSLLCFLCEFADILSEFEGWDSSGRRINLAATGLAGTRRDAEAVLPVSAQPDRSGMRRAIEEFNQASGARSCDKSAHDLLAKMLQAAESQARS
jgi:hypothetical protein